MNGTANESIPIPICAEAHLLMAADDRSEIEDIWQKQRDEDELRRHAELLGAVHSVRADVTQAIDTLRAEVGRINGNVRAQDKRLIWLEATEEERKRQAAIRGVSVGVEPAPRIPPMAKGAGLGAAGIALLAAVFEFIARMMGFSILGG
jgi:hypothetical protein